MKQVSAPQAHMVNSKGLGYWVMVLGSDATLLLLPSMVAKRADTGLIAASTLGVFLTWVLAALILAAIRMSSGHTIVEVAQQALGRWGGTLVVFFFLVVWFLHLLYTTDVVFDMVESYLLPKTPRWALGLYWFAFSGYVAWLGFDAAGRLAGMVAVPTLFVSFLLAAGALKLPIHWINLLPILGPGLGPLFHGALIISTVLFKTLLAVCAGVPPVRSQENVQKILVWGVAGSLVLQILQAVFVEVVLGPEGSQTAMLPALSIIQLYSSGFYLIRFDFVLIVVSLTISAVATGLFNLFLAEITARLFRIHRRWSILAVALLGFGFDQAANAVPTRLAEMPSLVWGALAGGYVPAAVVAVLAILRGRRKTG